MAKGSGIMLAAGGTGGHIFPAEALAKELCARGAPPSLVTDARFAKYEGDFGDIRRYIISAGSLGSGLYGKLKGLAGISLGLAQCTVLLGTARPRVVVGFGGYPSFPPVFAASMLNIKTVIHEQNAILGRANRMLAPRVHAIATSFAETYGFRPDAKGKVTLTGNPVRQAVRAVHDALYPELSENGMFRILVMGGSQGATVFSQVLPEAIRTLPQGLQRRIRLDQQCRPADIEAVRKAYTELGIQADLNTFFGDVPERLAAAHLVICRSGASTVAELLAAGRPSLLVPYPHATDDHQTANANAVEYAGAGWLMPQPGFTAEALSAKLEAFLQTPRTLSQAAEKAKQAARLNAAKDLADLVQRLAGVQ